MARIEHFNDPDAPTPNRLIPAASTVVTNEAGAILLMRRNDNDFWSIPGGAMEPGETIAETAIRETREETGIDIEIERLVGIYTNPHHVVEYSDGEVRQQFSVCFAGRPIGGELATSDESLDVGYFTASELDDMTIHDSIRLRIRDFLARRPEPVIA